MIKCKLVSFLQKKKRLAISATVLTLCCLFMTSVSTAQTYSFITAGDMESGNWAGVPGNTNLVVSFQAAAGTESSTALKTVTSSMGGDSYYILRCDQVFPMTSGD